MTDSIETSCREAENPRAPINTDATQPTQAAVQAPPCSLDITLTRDEAEYIAAFIDSENYTAVDDVVRLMVGDGHSGPGLYASHPEYPEECAVLVKKLAAAPEAPAHPPQDLARQMKPLEADAAGIIADNLPDLYATSEAPAQPKQADSEETRYWHTWGHEQASQPTQGDALNEKAEWLRELLRRSRGYILEASTRYYDGTDGAATRQGARGLLEKIDAAIATPPATNEPEQAAQGQGEREAGDVVAFELYNPKTGHAIVDYSRQTHVGHLTAEAGYEARPLVYAAPHQTVLDGSKPVPTWQAREALDELEAAARGDAPFPHSAAAVIRAALSAAPARAEREPMTEEEIHRWWASVNGLEDMDMARLADFRTVVRAVEARVGILKKEG